MLLEASLGATHDAFSAMVVLATAVVFASIVFAAAALFVAYKPFFGAKSGAAEQAHEPVLSLWLAPALLGGLGILFGMAPEIPQAWIVNPAVPAIAPQSVALELALWHGLNPALALSAVSLASGLAVYAGRKPIMQLMQRLELNAWWGPAQWWRLQLAALNAVAARQTQALQSGYLRHYLLIIIATTAVLGGARLFGGLRAADLPMNLDARFHEWVLAALILLGALTAVTSTSRLAAIAALGVVGYSVAVIFILFGAPDLAMTQFMIETLTVILFVLVFYHLPRFALFRGRAALVRDVAITLGLGAVITAVVLTGSGIQLYPKISRYFIENSLPAAHGRNVVNVILVDFRGFDTLGEITVLAVAGIGVFALLKLKLGGKPQR
jgi:multicomponent Na+:H+ antiporter subunit A